MSTTAELLRELNALRASSGEPPLKSWKRSKAELRARLEAMSNRPSDAAELTPVRCDALKGALALALAANPLFVWYTLARS